MKNKILSLLFVVIMLLSFCPNKTEADEYGYTIEVDGGLYGTVNGKERYFRKDIKPYSADGRVATFFTNEINVQVKDEYKEKYGFIGFQVSGRLGDDLNNSTDNTEHLTDTFKNIGNFVVNKDIILVAAYGVKSKLVQYLVKYVDEAGNQLHDPDMPYGMIGDKPVVAYRYIEGYKPKVETISCITLPGKNEEMAVFTFVYEKVEGGSSGSVEDDTTIVYINPIRDNGTTVRPGTTEDQGQDVEVIEEVVQVPEPAPEPGPVPTPSPEPEPEPEPEQKTILEQIGDMLTPLVNFVNDTIEANPVLGYSLAALLVIFGLLLLAFIVFLFVIIFKKKKRDADDQNPQAA